MGRKILQCAVMMLAALLVPCAAQAQKKDYLTSIEADKIRDAEFPAPRIKLFLEFASDRLKKFQYELARPAADRMRGERLKSLLNAYTGCVDDAADLIDLGVEKQQDIRAGIKEMQSKGKEFLATLQRIQAEAKEIESYRTTLEDAIDATQEALSSAEKAAKDLAPPPRRRN
jgi:peptidoglycan hydrolase CwlO-like protein